MRERISVLLVDDSPTFLSMAVRFLEEHYSSEVVVVGTARGGIEGLAQAMELHPDVVLLDLAMPDLPGLEAIPLLREALPEVRIIAATMLDADAYREPALAAGADDFLPKATLSTDLLPAIRPAAETRQPEQGGDPQPGFVARSPV